MDCPRLTMTAHPLRLLSIYYSPFTIYHLMNAENVAGGFSITPAIAELLFSSGIDVMTSGNHIFDKHEVIEYIKKQPRLLRPANYPPHTPGNGMWTGEVKGAGVA